MIRRARLAVSLTLAALLLHPDSASATCQSDGRPLCQTFWEYGVIFDGTVVNIEGIELDRSTTGKPEPFPYRIVTFVVHRAWKGVTGDRVQLLLEGGRRSDGTTVDVSETLRPELGVRYVIFGGMGRHGYVAASGCSASRPYSSAVEALELLYSLDRPATGGRILGRVSTRWEILRPGAEEPPRGITRVTLSGANVKRTVELTDGEFEFGGLPTGDFSLSIVRPSGMMPSGPHDITIATPRGCETAYINNFPDTQISGVVTSTDGKPLTAVLIELVDAEHWQTGQLQTLTTGTDEAGVFQFQGIPPGRYVVGTNLLNVTNDSNPYPRTLYEDGDKPLEVVVKSGHKLELGVLRVAPAPAEVPIAVQLIWPDGSPVSKRMIVIEDATGGLSDRERSLEMTLTNEHGHVDVTGRASRTYVASIWVRKPDKSTGMFEPIRFLSRRVFVTEPFRADTAAGRVRVALRRAVTQ